MTNIDEIYVGEYSPEQGCYNICTIKEMLANNLFIMENQTFNGYIPLCLGASYKDVKIELDEIKEKYGRPRTTCDYEE